MCSHACLQCTLKVASSSDWMAEKNATHQLISVGCGRGMVLGQAVPRSCFLDVLGSVSQSSLSFLVGKPTGCCKVRLPDYCRLSWLLPLLNPSRRPDSAAATVHQQHYLTRSITTGAIALTGFPNSNSEKNLYQGSFFKSISSGLISRLYKGW